MDIRPWTVAWSALAFMACAGLVAGVFEVQTWTPADLADWVQAIGSIAAVGGAAGVALFQAERQRVIEANRRRDALQDAEALVIERLFAAGDVCARAAKRARHAGDMTIMEDPNFLRMYPILSDEFALYSDRLSALLIEGLYSQEAKSRVLDAEAQLSMIRGIIREAGPDLLDDAKRKESRRQLRSSLRKAGKELESAGGALDQVGHAKRQALLARSVA